MNGNAITELERNNKTAMLCHLVEAVIIAGTFATEMLMGKRTPGYTIIVVALALAPVAAELYFWSRRHDTAMIKHLVAMGFAVMYSFILFTTTNHMTFIYVIPMVIVISIFNDSAYTMKICFGTTLESIIVVFVGAKTGNFGFRDMESGLLQLLVMILIGVYSYITARTLDANNQQKIARVEQAQNQTERVLREMSETYEKLENGIRDIHNKVEELEDSSSITKGAMEDVTSGASDAAEAVQKQIVQTEEIQQKVGMVDTAAGEIMSRMEQTLRVLAEGNKDVEKLVGEVELSVENGAQVAEKLEQLDTNISEMNSIVELITGITTQTSMLSLNASIEAARAGEAGRGFAVVATEISSMASRTKEATVHITQLIENVSEAIRQVVNVIRGMLEGINAEKEATMHTADSFGMIEEHTYAVRDNLSRLTKSVEELKAANEEIAGTIQTISAVSEEVLAHANETLTAEEENMRNLLNMAGRSQELMELTRHS